MLKIPDGSFSRGVFKVNDRAELLEQAGKLFKSSRSAAGAGISLHRIRLAGRRFSTRRRCSSASTSCPRNTGRFTTTNGQARGIREGDSKTFRVEDAPEIVVKTALKAANLIGNGFYGVDLKQTAKGVVVIEVNDNPNVDQGVEDAVLKEESVPPDHRGFRLAAGSEAGEVSTFHC